MLDEKETTTKFGEGRQHKIMSSVRPRILATAFQTDPGFGLT